MASGGRGSGHQSSEDQGIDPCQFASGSYRRSKQFYSLLEKKFFSFFPFSSYRTRVRAQEPLGAIAGPSLGGLGKHIFLLGNQTTLCTVRQVVRFPGLPIHMSWSFISPGSVFKAYSGNPGPKGVELVPRVGSRYQSRGYRNGKN